MRKTLMQARKSADYTQVEIAEKLKITTRQYQRIESGKVIGKVDMWDYLEDLFEIPQRKLREIQKKSD